MSRRLKHFPAPQTFGGAASRFPACHEPDGTQRGPHEKHARCTGEAYVLDVGLVRCPCYCHRRTP